MRFAKLVVIGFAAGAFSGLFGVGGGTVIVPLLIFWFAYGERLATGTSLAAIAIIATFATGGHAGYGNVDWLHGALIGVPAIGGVVIGAALQQRIDQRWLSVMFALLLLVVAGELAL